MHCGSFVGRTWSGKEGHLTLMPSLQSMALVKIAVSVCSKPEMRPLLKEIRNDFLRWYGPNMRRRVGGRDPFKHLATLRKLKERARGLLPEPLNSRSSVLGRALLDVIPSIAIEIEKWMEDHSGFLPRGFDALRYFHWKCVGIIDREKTARVLLQQGNLPADKYLQLAGYYAMQTEVFSYWDKLSEDVRQQLYAKYLNTDAMNHWVKRCRDRSSGCELRLIGCASEVFNTSALRYFYDVCVAEAFEKMAYLMTIILMQSKNAHLVCACVSELLKLDGLQLRSNDSYNIIVCFLNWPLQGLFLDIANRLIFDLELNQIKFILDNILKIILERGLEDYNYIKLLKDLLDLILPWFRDQLREDPHFAPLLDAMRETRVESMTREWLQERVKLPPPDPPLPMSESYRQFMAAIEDDSE